MPFIIATNNMKKSKSNKTYTGPFYGATSKASLKGIKEWSKKMGNQHACEDED